MEKELSANRMEITRTVLAVIAILLLLVGAMWVLMPFLGALIWATTIVVATWPLMEMVQRRLWGRRSLAVVAMMLILLMLLFVPLSIAVVTIVEHADDVSEAWPQLLQAHPPEPPVWVAQLPMLGESVARIWHDVAVSGYTALITLVKPYAGITVKWVAAHASGLGMLIVQFLLTVVIAGVLYVQGETAVRGVRGFARRLAGVNGDKVVTLAGQAIRGVALGIVVTALVQSALGALGLLVVGVPYAGILGALMFLLCLVQIGPLLVLLPAIVWLFWSGDTGWGIVLSVWTLVVASLDNVLRPWLIRKGADLPLLLIFVGVIGGLLSFGLIGLFVGPVLLAVTYTLLDAWIGDAYDVAPTLTPATTASSLVASPADAEENGS